MAPWIDVRKHALEMLLNENQVRLLKLSQSKILEWKQPGVLG